MREERRKAKEKALRELKGEEEVIEIDNNVEEIDNEEENEEKEERKRKIFKAIIYLIIIIVISVAYIKTIATKHIEVKEYKIETSIIPDSFDGLKIVQISDIHYGTSINEIELKNIVKKTNELKPDVVFFTGDLFDKDISLSDESITKIIEELSNIEVSLYKYAIYGDMDNQDKFAEIMEKSNFIILNNETKLLYYNDNNPIVIAGINKYNEPNYNLFNNTEELNMNNLYKIVLIHEPDDFNQIKDYNPSLVLAGHSLGGLIKLPFIKPLILQEGSKTYYNDYQKINETDFYISSGLGTTKFHARLNNRPSISLYRLYKVAS